MGDQITENAGQYGRIMKKMYNSIDYTKEHDFGTWKVYCVSNVTFHAEFKYAIKIFPSPTVFVQWQFYYWFFGILGIFFSDIIIREPIF